MAIGDDQVATLRAHLAGEFEEYERRWEQLDKEAARTEYTALVAAAFFEAVDRRFAKDGTVADVIDFVGDVRSRSEELSDAIDPRIAERLIRHALGDGSIGDIGDETMGSTQMLLLVALIADEQLDDAGLDEFMTEVRAVADEWTE
jgi:hypothetical protein